MLEVYAIRTIPERDFEPFAPLLMELLPPDGAAAVMRFRRTADRQRSLLGEALTRARLSALAGEAPRDLSIRRLEKGKPVLDERHGYHFNVSHSGDWVVAAISDREVGIDVERIRVPQYRIAERFFSREELRELEGLAGAGKQHYFFDLWTLKESYLKMLGKGLTQSLGSFTLRRTGDTFSLVLEGITDAGVRFLQYPLDPGYRLSVCCRSEVGDGHFERITIQELSTRLNSWQR